MITSIDSGLTTVEALKKCVTLAIEKGIAVSMKGRVGDKMISVEVSERPAVIPFETLLKAVTVIPDQDAAAPWEDLDGYEHEYTTRADLYRKDLPIGVDELRKSRGWFYGNGYVGLLTLKPAADVGLFEWAWARGASKQVAAELVAAQRRQTLEQLKKWYTHGSQHWFAKCEFEGEEDSVGFQDDDGSYTDEIKEDLARSVAHDLTRRGFEVTGIPDGNTKEKRLACRKLTLSYNLALFNWKE